MKAVVLKTHLVLAALRLIACLPFRVLYLLSDITCFLLQYVIHYRKHVIFGNLQRSFPEKNKDEIKQIAHQFYHHLSDCIFETIKLLHISDKQLEQRIKVRGGDLIERLAEDGRSIIVFLGHYGNWEWVQEVTRHYRRPSLNAEIYRPVKDLAMNEVLKQIRARFATTPIPQKQAVRHLLQLNREGRQFLVGFVADQRPNSKNLYHWTSFLNQDTAYAAGGEEIGKHINAHFVFLNIEKPQRGHYVMTFQEIATDKDTTDEHPYTLQFFQLMEACIRKAPAYWLWSHNRWEFDRNGNTIHKK